MSGVVLAVKVVAVEDGKAQLEVLLLDTAGNELAGTDSHWVPVDHMLVPPLAKMMDASLLERMPMTNTVVH